MAQQVIDIPGVGAVEFPAEMSDAEVSRAAKKLYEGAQKPKQPEKPKTFLDTHPNIRSVVQGSLNALPLAGGLAGGVLGAPGALETAGATSVGGGMLGYAAGAGLRDLALESLGLQKPTTPMQKAGSMVTEAAIGEIAPRAVGAAGEAVANASKSKIAHAALAMMSHVPGYKTAAKLAHGAMSLADVVGAKEAAQAAKSVVDDAAEFEGEAAGKYARGTLHYLTGNAMVDASQADRMILAKQRAMIVEIANDKAAREAADAAAAAAREAAKAAKLADAKAIRAKELNAYLTAGTRALVAGSHGSDQETTK